MKKFFKFFAVATVMLCATAALFSCSEDEEDFPGDITKLQRIAFNSNLNLDGDAQTVFDYTATITYPNGNQDQVSLTQESSSRMVALEVEDLSFPANFSVTVVRTPKEDYTPDATTTASWSEDFEIAVTLLDKNSDTIMSKVYGSPTEHKGVRIKDFLDAGRGNYSQTLTLTVEKTNDGYTISNNQ